MQPATYQRRRPEKTVVYEVVRRHLNTFLALADARAADGRGLPKYVRQAFLRFLKCGILAHGFARVRCGNCRYETLVSYS